MKSGEQPVSIAQIDITGSAEFAGDYYYRTYAPGISMAQCPEVHVINLTNENRYKERIARFVDVLILNLICDPDWLPIIRHRQKLGKATLFELNDDIWNMPACNPSHRFYSAENTYMAECLARSCDALQFSSKALFDKYGHWNKRSVLFENHMLEIPPPKRYERKDVTTIGWGGSLGHMRDLEEIAQQLIEWVLSRTDVKLHLMCAEPIWDLFAAVPDDRKKRFETGSISDYYRFLETLDIGIAPLSPTPYNQGRSDIKFVELAAHGVVPVVQAAGPYLQTVKHAVRGFLYRDVRELLSILDSLCNDIRSRIRTSIAAREYVLNERLFVTRAADRVQFYRAELLKSRRRGSTGETAPDPQPPANGNGKDLEFFSTVEGARQSGRHVILTPTAFEQLLREGLFISQHPERVPHIGNCAIAAAEIFDRAASLEPASYLPYLYGAYCSGNVFKSLHEALRRNPFSIRAWDLLGMEYARVNDRERARQCFEKASLLSGDYRPAFRKASTGPMSLEVQSA